MGALPLGSFVGRRSLLITNKAPEESTFKRMKTHANINEQKRKKAISPDPFKIETEAEFTQRLWDENPRGIKGLAYVLMEIRRAIAEGIVKPEITLDAKGTKGINKFAQMFTKAASTRHRQTERVINLISSLKQNTMKIMHHTLKEQNFSNEESIVEKNEVFLNKIVSSQKNQLDQFFTKIEGRMNDMRQEISTVKSKVNDLKQINDNQKTNTRN